MAGNRRDTVEQPDSLIPLQHGFYDRSTDTVARGLIGRLLIHMTPRGPVGGYVVETEAYGPDDPANHAFRGKTGRNATMFGPPGHAYVYRIYGVHWCLNAVTRGAGVGEAVLIRALHPFVGVEIMRHNRRIDDELRLCRGPGLLCTALGITGELDGEDLAGRRLLISAEREEGLEIQTSTRVGLSKAADRLWRYFVAESPFVSGPRRALMQAR